MPNLWIHLMAISATPATAVGSGTPPVALSVVLGWACCAVGLLAGVFGLGIWLAIRRRQTDDETKVKQ
jgi:hypothetical protein